MSGSQNKTMIFLKQPRDCSHTSQEGGEDAVIQHSTTYTVNVQG